METTLKDFVKQVLLDLSAAVEEAKSAAPVAIAPGAMNGKLLTEPQLVHFDLSISSTSKNSSKSSKGGGATVVTVIKANANSEKNEATSFHEVNRIKFSVPVYFQGYLPRHKIGEEG